MIIVYSINDNIKYFTSCKNKPLFVEVLRLFKQTSMCGDLFQISFSESQDIICPSDHVAEKTLPKPPLARYLTLLNLSNGIHSITSSYLVALS